MFEKKSMSSLELRQSKWLKGREEVMKQLLTLENKIFTHQDIIDTDMEPHFRKVISRDLIKKHKKVGRTFTWTVEPKVISWIKNKGDYGI